MSELAVADERYAERLCGSGKDAFLASTARS